MLKEILEFRNHYKTRIVIPTPHRGAGQAPVGISLAHTGYQRDPRFRGDDISLLHRYWQLAMSFGFTLFFAVSCAVTQPPVPVASLNRDAAREMRKDKNYWIEVQIPQRKIILAKGDHIIKAFPIAVGMPVFPTPVGWRTVNSVVWNPWWNPPKESSWVEDPTPISPRHPDNPLGEIKMPLGEAYLIHGTKAVYSIGQWASHGCIRMLFEDIFGLVQLLLSEYSNVSAVDEMEKANRDPKTEFFTRLNRDIPVFLTYDLVKVRDGYVSIAPDFYNYYPDRVGFIAFSLKPYLKEDQRVSEKKVKNLLKIFKNRNIYVPLASLVN